MSSTRKAKTVRYLILLALILLAAGLRLWHLNVLPPGLYGDEAINGVDERMMLAGRGLPIYFVANNGREPLFLYLQAAALAVLGFRPFALHIVAALAGILTVPAIYLCAYWLLRPAPGEPDESGRGESSAAWAALIGSAGIAVSFWALSLSRLALRAVLLPPLSAVAIALFWRAWTGGQRRHYIWAGVWFAACLYTYTAARLLPLVPLSFVILEALLAVWRARQERSQGKTVPVQAAQWRGRVIGLVWLTAVCGGLLLPFAVSSLREPDLVWRRAGQVSIFAAPTPGQVNQSLGWPRFIKNVGVVARNFYDLGDRNLRQNIPNRPVNDLLLAALFTLGWLAALVGLRKARYRLLLIWLAVMLLPLILSTGIPHNLRGAAGLAPLGVLYAAGAQVLLRAAQKSRRPNAVLRFAAPILLGVVILISGVWTVRDYFGTWATSAGLGDAFTLQQALAGEAAGHLIADSSPDRPVLISNQLYLHPQMSFALGLPEQVALPAAVTAITPTARTRFLLEGDFDPGQTMALIWREGDRMKTSAVQPLAPELAAALHSEITGRKGVQVIRAPGHQEGWSEVFTGDVPAGARLQPRAIPNPLDVHFANGVRLAGYDIKPDWLPAGARPAQFQLSLFWEIEPGADLNSVLVSDAFIHLKNDQGVWQTDNGGLPTNYLAPWLRERYMIEDRRVVAVPPDMPPGKAMFEVGLYRSTAAAERDRIDILDGEGRAVADRVDLGTVSVRQPPPAVDVQGMQPTAAQFDGRIDLTGWQARRDPFRPDTLLVDLGWQARSRSTTDYTAFVHLINAAGQIVAQFDQPPGGTENPTTHWVPGETVASSFTLQLPAAKSTEGLRLRVGLYEPVSGKQLPVTNEADGAVETHNTYVILPWTG
jgi:hypothetical protein